MRAATSAETAALILGVDGAGVAATIAVVREVILVGVCDRGLVCGCESYDVGVATKADRVLSSGVVAADDGVLDRALSMTREASVREVERVVRVDLCCRGVCATAGVGGCRRALFCAGCEEKGEACEDVMSSAEAGRAGTESPCSTVSVAPAGKLLVGNESALVLASAMRYV